MDGRQAILSLFNKPRIVQRDIGGPALEYINGFSGVGHYFPDNRGVGTAEGGGMLGTRIGERPIASSFYPVASDFSANKWPVPSRWIDHARLQERMVMREVLRGADHRGFGYCYNWIYTAPASEVHELLKSKPTVSQVRSEPIVGIPNEYRGIDGLPVFYERDEYYFELMDMSIDSTRGDV